MFKKKEETDMNALEKLTDVSKMHKEQIIKYYFNEHSVSSRKSFLKQIDSFQIVKTIDDFNEETYKFYMHVRIEEAKALPLLLHSIILNSLAYESNEDLKDGLFDDYRNKNISKFAKPFIAGQYKIYRNSYEQLFGISEEKTMERCSHTEDVIKLLVEYGIDMPENLKVILEARKIDEKRMLGIAKKIVDEK